jgi:hypothetical protein
MSVDGASKSVMLCLLMSRKILLAVLQMKY